MRPINYVRVVILLLLTRRAYNCRVVLTRLIRNGLHLVLVVRSGNSLSLVDATASRQYSLLFRNIIRLMVHGQVAAVIASIVRHDCSAIAYVHHKDAVLYEQGHDGARARLVKHVVAVLRECINSVQEIGLSFLVSVDDSLAWVSRELRVLDNELMQVVTEEVGACVAAMAVEHTKEAALGPVLDVLLVRRLHNVQHDADAVFVVVADDALVSVGRVTHNQTILSHTTLGRLPAGKVEQGRVWRLLVAEQQFLNLRRVTQINLLLT